MSTATDIITDADRMARTLALVVAERDGIHPAHALNRVRAACRLVEVSDRQFRDTNRNAAAMDSGNPARAAWRTRIAEEAGVQASDATWDIAAWITCTDTWFD